MGIWDFSISGLSIKSWLPTPSPYKWEFRISVDFLGDRILRNVIFDPWRSIFQFCLCFYWCCMFSFAYLWIAYSKPLGTQSPKPFPGTFLPENFGLSIKSWKLVIANPPPPRKCKFQLRTGLRLFEVDFWKLVVDNPLKNVNFSARLDLENLKFTFENWSSENTPPPPPPHCKYVNFSSGLDLENLK